MLDAEQERKYDRFEEHALTAMMIGKVNNARKRIKLSDLFKRPEKADVSTQKAENLYEKQQKASEWLSQFEIK
ncbi:hypothetical protein [Bacillus glycinifermentans]|uniref:hypothetical protein n=1 Tax=Bacillus glycinifermentans TaxID=1664069 RepID=UPI00081C098B|nr:hypothetical protein [Bacillus glycinifermentans]MBU8785667.1 hypothetical protein [Bacillus glycinifermentans]NUJ19566.1 hypothetical protein [Bacillus glycinifermentans]WKB78820.1 hypothetical protein QYM22_08285 [Bacillus glycinifermentans]